jgi:hypothetical protein
VFWLLSLLEEVLSAVYVPEKADRFCRKRPDKSVKMWKAVFCHSYSIGQRSLR